MGGDLVPIIRMWGCTVRYGKTKINYPAGRIGEIVFRAYVGSVSGS